MRRTSLRYLALALLVAGVAGGAWATAADRTASPPKPRRVVSLNLCADQLVLALADRDQIAGLTRNAADRDMSAEAARTRGLRILTNSAEEILAIDPDLVIGMPARRSAAMGVLQGRHYATLDLKAAESLTQIEASIRRTAAALGHPQRGQALIAGMRRDLAGVPRLGNGKVAAYYQRRGFMTGTGLLCVLGFGLAVAALAKNRSSKVTGVPTHAVVGLVLSALPLIAAGVVIALVRR